MQERFDGLKEKPRGIADAVDMVVLVADRAAHFLQQELATRNFIAAQLGALELLDQKTPRPRRKLPEVFPASDQRLARLWPFLDQKSMARDGPS